MGFEKRGNRYYYYEKRRIGDRVESIYLGGGFEEPFPKPHANGRPHANDEKSQKLHLEMSEQSAIDSMIDEVCDNTFALVDALYLINGYHTHKRQWRRKRDAK